jgi:hypothetical protein
MSDEVAVVAKSPCLGGEIFVWNDVDKLSKKD